MLPGSNYPPLPTARLDTLYSYYPYFPISARERAHASLRPRPYVRPASTSTTSTTTGVSGAVLSPHEAPRALHTPARGHTSSATTSTTTAIAGPSSGAGAGAAAAAPSASDRRRDARRACDRAALRALRGLRPAGISLGLDAGDLSDEEEAVEEERASVNAFGHRFLLPFGRRLTQMEMEAAPSPTPSDHEHRQEDNHHNNQASPLPPPSEHSPGLEAEDAVVDLDASIEDRDGDGGGDPDRSTEYDSDDLRLMRAMDRSVGSRTPESEDGEDLVPE